MRVDVVKGIYEMNNFPEKHEIFFLLFFMEIEIKPNRNIELLDYFDLLLELGNRKRVFFTHSSGGISELSRNIFNFKM